MRLMHDQCVTTARFSAWHDHGGEHVNQQAAALKNLAQQCGYFRVARQPPGLHAGALASYSASSVSRASRCLA